MEQKQLSGKIFWIAFDFKFSGFYEPKDGETHFIGTKVSNIIISEEMIKFYAEPHEINGEKISYYVNMDRKETGLGYEGKFTLENDEEYWGKVTCDLYQNPEGFFLYGSWNENDEIYTWFARISNEKFKNK